MATCDDHDKVTDLQGRMGRAETDIIGIKDDVKENYVSKDQNYPVKSIAWGLAGTVLTAVVLAGMGLIFSYFSK